MENNTVNYTEYTFPDLLKQYGLILVPMIQRDYAQGRADKKATDVRNNLLTDIFSSEEVHFDLVFGSKEQRIVDGEKTNCFIPVDGQQRLTTLFLLYLYGQKQKNLYQDLQLSRFSYDTRRAASDFCKCITSQDWKCDENNKVSDIIKDSSWFMDYWENDPTVAGMLNMLDAIHKKYKEVLTFPELKKVTFYFFDLDSNGLNENLYLKMNSRGKPLTAFENLKAKIEKVLPDKIEIEKKCFPECKAAPKDSFKEKWKYFMDRNWTKIFWDIEHPEKYDVYIAEFIVRFLSGYWAAYSGEKKISDKLKEINSKNSYGDYIQFEPIEEVLNLENAFPRLAYALTTLIDDSKIKPYWSKESDKIKVSEKSGYKIIAVVFTYVLFDGDESAMRFAWNMAENYVTGYDTYVAYCERVKKIHDYWCFHEVGVMQTLKDKEFENPSEQLKEEIAKAKQILDENNKPRKYNVKHKEKEDGPNFKTWEDIIIEAEKYAFFKGAIRFLYTNNEGTIDWNDFATKWENAQRYFNGNDIIPTTNIAEYFTDDQIKVIFNRFSFNTKNWKSILLQKSMLEPVHRFLIGVKTESNSELLADIRNILGSIDTKDVWLLQDWQHCEVVLTNYSARRSEPYNGYVYQVGNEVRNRWNNIVSKISEIEVYPPQASGKETIEINGQVYYRGLWTDIKYRKHYFRYFGNNTICLMTDDRAGKKLEDNNEGNKPGNYIFDVSYCFDETEYIANNIILSLDCLIAQAFPEASDKACCNDCQNKVCE